MKNHLPARHLLVAAAAVLIAGSAAAAPVTPPNPTLRITHFRLHATPSTAMATTAAHPLGASSPQAGTGMASTATTAGSAAAAAASSTTSIALGEELTLGWRIDACHLQSVSITLSGEGAQPSGERRQERDGCYWLSGTRTVRPQQTTEYRLTVGGTPVADARVAPAPINASYRVVVQRPRLDVLTPRVDQTARRLTFFARNTGEADFVPSVINVRYDITGVQRGGSPPVLTQGSARFANVAIARGQTVELGSATFGDLDRVFSYDMVSIGVNLVPTYTAPLDGDRDSFQHTWETRTSTIQSGLMSMIGRASRLEVRLNNFSATAAGRTIRNDSFVELDLLGAVTTVPFDIPATNAVLRVSGSVTGHTYAEMHFLILINSILANLERRDDFLTIRNGKLVIHLEFPNPGAQEVKLLRREDGRLDDDFVPDINIGSFAADILITPGLSTDRTRLAIADVSVEVPPLTARLEGRFEGLNPFIRDTLNNAVHNEIVKQFRALLRRSDVKRAFENGLGTVTDGLRITRITRLEAAGDRITLTYI